MSLQLLNFLLIELGLYVLAVLIAGLSSVQASSLILIVIVPFLLPLAVLHLAAILFGKLIAPWPGRLVALGVAGFFAWSHFTPLLSAWVFAILVVIQLEALWLTDLVDRQARLTRQLRALGDIPTRIVALQQSADAGQHVQQQLANERLAQAEHLLRG